jgi:hypothetical protein
MPPMSRRGGRRLGGAAIILAVIAATLAAPGAAGAATGTDRNFAGFGNDVSCLSATRCVVVGYNTKGVGDVVPVVHGAPGKAKTVPKTSFVYGVSCPSAKGCVAVADPNSGAGAAVVPINSKGVPGKAAHPSTSAGDALTHIACTTRTSCTLVGTNIFTSPASIVMSTWNGKKLTRHTVKSVKGSSSTVVEGVTCVGTTCYVAGYAVSGPKVTGFVVRTSHGKPGKLQTVAGDNLYDVGCKNSTHCWAVGFDQAGGVIVTLSSAKMTARKHVHAPLAGIACRDSACTAVGEQLPVSPQTSESGFIGVYLHLSDGVVKNTTVDTSSGGYTGVDQSSPMHFAAVGAASKGSAASEVTTG